MIITKSNSYLVAWTHSLPLYRNINISNLKHNIVIPILRGLK